MSLTKGVTSAANLSPGAIDGDGGGDGGIGVANVGVGWGFTGVDGGVESDDVADGIGEADATGVGAGVELATASGLVAEASSLV